MGLFEIFLGAICGLFAVFLLVAGLLVPHPQTANPPSMIPAFLMYLFWSGQFFTFGIGTLLAKRWARKLMLVLSWFWLFAGFCGLGFAFSMSGLFDAAFASGALPPATAALMKITLGVVLALIFIAMPGLFILFYGNKKTTAAVEALDPKPSWTDSCPAPVLLLSVMSGLGALFMLTYMPSYHFVIPCFGLILDGAAGALVCLLATGAMGYVAWGAFQLKKSAWWTALALLLFWSGSYLLIFSTQGLGPLYAKMQIPEKTMDLMKQSGILDSPSSLLLPMAAVCGFYLVFLIWIRKYFK